MTVAAAALWCVAAVAAQILPVTRDGGTFAGRYFAPHAGEPGARAAAAVLIPLFDDDDTRRCADALVAGMQSRGIAMLTYDARGMTSANDASRSVRLMDHAADVAAAVDALRRRADIDSARVALVAIGPGGWAAVLADSMSPYVASLVRIGAPEAPPSAQMRFRLTRDMSRAGFSNDTVRAFGALHARLLDYLETRVDRSGVLTAIDSTLATREAKRAHKRGWLRDWIRLAREETTAPADSLRMIPWMRDISFDPSPLTCRSRTPTLSMYGQDDALVHVPESTDRLRDALDFCSGTLGEVVVVAHGDHSLRVPAGSDPNGTREIPVEVFDRIAAYIAGHPLAGP